MSLVIRVVRKMRQKKRAFSFGKEGTGTITFSF